ncbi:MAG: DsbC family protein [Wenzhouxiangella sp.]|nr:DsbC family protein [Wenzhouxiangella sp.]
MHRTATAAAASILFALLGLSASPLLAADDETADHDAVEARLSGLVPETTDVAINESPIDGVLEVRLGGDVVYMSDDGKHLFQGRLIDLDTREDLTGRAQNAIRQERIADIDPDQFITFGPDNPTHRLMVFTDPDCGYCRRLHEQIDSYVAEGIEINYMGFPRAGENSATFDKLVSVWCAADQHQAMTTAKAGGELPARDCDHPVSEHYQLGQDMGVTGTPALMGFDGSLIPGFVPADELKARLDQQANAR